MSKTTRRQLLRRTATAGTLLGLDNLSFLFRLRPVFAKEARVDPKIVRLRPEIEPTVRLLEETPRESLLEEVAARIERGLSYREILTALLLAGVRNVQPRPSVGYKFHAVLVVNSAHLASLAASDSQRWLPIFWALDHFKNSQARDVKEGDWTMAPVDEPKVPPAHKARKAFVRAMDEWDEPAADSAVAGLARFAGAAELFDLFCWYGVRDFRSIGHKIIFVANSWRTLQCIGWHHAEPVLRSLAYALLNHEGESNPSKNDLAADRPWRGNQQLARRIRAEWQQGRTDSAATSEMLAVFHHSSAEAACEKVVELLNLGIDPQSIWDAIFTGAGELLMRQPGIVALHAVTSTNAIRFCYRHCGNDETRRLLLLQNAAFLPLFREAMEGRGKVADLYIDQLESVRMKSSGREAIEEIFVDVSSDRMSAAQKTLAYLQDDPDAKSLIGAARLLVFFKGDDSHDYKFSSAVLEDYYHISPAWRDRFLAMSMFRLHGSLDRDNELIQRTRSAFES